MKIPANEPAIPCRWVYEISSHVMFLQLLFWGCGTWLLYISCCFHFWYYLYSFLLILSRRAPIYLKFQNVVRCAHIVTACMLFQISSHMSWIWIQKCYRFCALVTFIHRPFSVSGLDNLQTFLDHINILHPSTKFTLEVQKNDKTIPFFDVLFSIPEDGSLGHRFIGNQHTQTGICIIFHFIILVL